MRVILTLGAIVVSTAASAQLGQNQPTGPDNGFFRPTPGNDPSVHAPVAPVTRVVAQPQPAQPEAVPVYVPVMPAAAQQQQERAAEQDLDRAQREARDAQLIARQQPARINGAFTGDTDPRNR